MIAVMQRIFVCVLSTCIGTAIVAFGSAAILFLLALRAWGVVRAAALKPAWGLLSPRSTLVGQGSSDSPPGCHSLLPQFSKAAPPDPYFASRRFKRHRSADWASDALPQRKKDFRGSKLVFFTSKALENCREQTDDKRSRRLP